MSRKFLWVGGLILLGVLAGGLFLIFSPASVQTVKPHRGEAVEAVYATGTVESVRYAYVGSKVIGRVTDVPVREGEKVSEGQVLAVLDAREAISQLQEARAKLDLARSDLSRARRLFKGGHVSKAALDQAVSVSQAAESAVEGAKARLDEHFILAPLTGEVLRSVKQIKPGDMVGANQNLFLIGDPSSLEINAEVDEEDIPRIKPGQVALIRADAFSGQALKGRVSRITPHGDPVARTYRVYILLPSDTPLLSGMTTEINIVVDERKDALLVPVTAISGAGVWVFKDGRAHLADVTLGTVGEEMAEIKSGLDDTAEVIANPPSGLEEGQRVQAAPAEKD
ncbi:efflux RND transporter periplasmic adaptor subunit [Parvibaculum sp.]|uniref:efflux RND transporter periplasmic adaptor subunit n=1 Tax=Parvibaculum sp. TaxID=2024848 RepID=UPI000C91EEE5|nr:efflux RND transporter periplasmic adaptor subunit [Parvibaculum sp.]MAB14609.1 efflux transporter periplasmic adaptor subunit [Parvibaculum sp.]